MSHKRTFTAENAINGTRAQLRALSGTKGGAPPGSNRALTLLASLTYRLYCSGSKVPLLSLRARLLAPPLATAARKYLRYANYDA